MILPSDSDVATTAASTDMRYATPWTTVAMEAMRLKNNVDLRPQDRAQKRNTSVATLTASLISMCVIIMTTVRTVLMKLVATEVLDDTVAKTSVSITALT